MSSHALQSRHDVYSQLLLQRKHWRKTIGVISCKALREEPNRDELNRVIELLASPQLCKLINRRDLYLAFTGGTYRALHPKSWPGYDQLQGRLFCLAPSALGVIQIINLVVYGYLRAVLFFNDMEDYYADSPQNLCLRRICNHYDVPMFEDFSSIEYMVSKWELLEERTNRKDDQKKFPAAEIYAFFSAIRNDEERDSISDSEETLKDLVQASDLKDEVLSRKELRPAQRQERGRGAETLAVVAHNQMKMHMLNFCLRRMDEILSYRRVLTTGTTGARLTDQFEAALEVRQNIAPEVMERWGWRGPEEESVQDFLHRKIQPYRSGPLGGDIQISSKVIDGTCHRVLFFQDPQTAHPHQFDIRLMEKVVQDHETATLFATSVETAELMV